MGFATIMALRIENSSLRDYAKQRWETVHLGMAGVPEES